MASPRDTIARARASGTPAAHSSSCDTSPSPFVSIRAKAAAMDSPRSRRSRSSRACACKQAHTDVRQRALHGLGIKIKCCLLTMFGSAACRAASFCLCTREDEPDGSSARTSRSQHSPRSQQSAETSFATLKTTGSVPTPPTSITPCAASGSTWVGENNKALMLRSSNQGKAGMVVPRLSSFDFGPGFGSSSHTSWSTSRLHGQHHSFELSDGRREGKRALFGVPSMPPPRVWSMRRLGSSTASAYSTCMALPLRPSCTHALSFGAPHDQCRVGTPPAVCVSQHQRVCCATAWVAHTHVSAEMKS